jgi:hypothetical protein
MKTPRVLLAAALLALSAACSADVTAPDAPAVHPAGPSRNAGHHSTPPGSQNGQGQGQGQGTGGTTTTAAGAEIEAIGSEGGYLGSGGGR